MNEIEVQDMPKFIRLMQGNRFIVLGLVCALVYLLLEPLVYSVVFHTGELGWSFLIGRNPYEYLHRVVTVVMIMVFGVMAQVITRKSREVRLALAESRDNYVALADSTFSGILIHIDGKIVEANDKVAGLYGYTKEGLLGMSTLELTSPESRKRVERMMTEELETPYEAVGLRRDGFTFEMEIFSKNITYLGQPARISAIRDITHIKDYSSLMRLKQDSEDLLLKIVTMFVASDNVDHMIGRALEEFGTYSSACRIHVFELRGDGIHMDNTYEWCAPGYDRMMEGVRGINLDNFHSELDRIRQSETLGCVLDFNPNLSVKDREMLEFVRHRGDAFVDIPLYLRSSFVGVLSLEYDDDQSEEMKDQTMIRQIFSEMLEIILERKRSALLRIEEGHGDGEVQLNPRDHHPWEDAPGI